MEMPRVSWEVLLEGDRAARAEASLETIVRDLLRALALPGPRHGSVSNGLAGVAIFFAYLDRAFPGHGHDETAIEALDRSIDQMPGLPEMLFAGYTGIAWAAEHLKRMGLVEDDGEEDPFREIDEALLVHLRQRPFRAEFELIQGLAGLAVYALERLPHPLAAECLELIVDHLAEAASADDAGTSWFSSPDILDAHSLEEYPDGVYNLGVAHGVPAVPPVLAEIARHGIRAERARELLEGAMSWLLAQRLDDGVRGERSVFPAALAPGKPPELARCAWCYGDPGIVAALLWAAASAGRRDWEEDVLAVARVAAGVPFEESKVKDAGLCHGSAGLAHIFNRVYQRTGEELFRKRAVYWLDRTFDYRVDGALGGYRYWAGHLEQWRESPGLLMGCAGIGLALLAATTPVEPSWDRLLVMSVPPRS